MIEKHIDEAAAEKLLHRFTITYNGKEISIDSVGVAGFIEFFIRKGAHVFEYAVLGALLYRAIQSTGISRGKSLFIDVLIDSVGVLVGIVMVMIFYNKRNV